MFLDIPKIFETICHERLLLKLNGNGIFGSLLKLLGNFWMWKQGVGLNRLHSSSVNVDAGDPLGSILGRLLLLIRINNLPKWVSSNCKLFTDNN